MLQLFRISTLYKFFFLFLVFLAIRLPAILLDIPLMKMEVKWMLVGEQISKGMLLYADIWDNTPPLSALVYTLIHLIFGKSQVVYGLLSSILIFIQAILLNQYFMKREVFLDFTQIPALLYLILTSIFIDFYTLSPSLLAITPLLVVIDLTFSQMSEKQKRNRFFEIGIYLGIASLFYLPSFIFIFVPLIAFTLYTSVRIQNLFAVFIGLFFILGITFLLFYLTNQEYNFYLNYLSSLFSLSPKLNLPIFDFLILYLIPFILFILSFMSLLGAGRFNNYQTRCQNVMLLWSLVSIIILFLGSSFSPHHFIFFIPALAFILTHYLLNPRFYIIKEFWLIILLCTCLYFNYQNTYQILPKLNTKLSQVLQIDMKNLLVQPVKLESELHQKKVLVIGENMDYYKNSQLATPYLNWRLTGRHFNNLDKYDILLTIHQNFQEDMPDVIVDEKKLMPQLQKSFAFFETNYEIIPNTIFYKRR